MAIVLLILIVLALLAGAIFLVKLINHLKM